MKISAVKLLREKDGLLPFELPMLGDVVIVTGGNGAGKTRLFKLMENYVKSLHEGSAADDFDIEICDNDILERLTNDNVNKVQIINYSHYDARLQSPVNFSPYVIHKAKELLKKCNYEETALNSLLFIEDMAKGYSDEFRDGRVFKCFKEDLKATFGIEIDYDSASESLTIFGLDVESAGLSPGQQYLLRMEVACFQNKDEDGLIFFMDEPELHLHPKALLEMLEKLREKFPRSQFWLSTHSLLLISFYAVMHDHVTVLYLKDNKVDLFRSDSSDLLQGLIGNATNQFAVQQFFALPDEYACNRFTFECFDKPTTLRGKDGTDVQVGMINTQLSDNDIIVDYGVGKGRFLEELCLGDMDSGETNRVYDHYYAYDPSSDDALICRQVMNNYGSTEENYYNDIEKLQAVIQGEANYVLLVNVLHEIPPTSWVDVFGNIKRLLKPEGKLLIVERDELMIGESPYDQKFLMLTSNGCRALFGTDGFQEVRHPKKKYIVKYVICGKNINVDAGRVKACIEAIQKDAIDKISFIKRHTQDEGGNRFKTGMKMAFWLHQYANASLILREKE